MFWGKDKKENLQEMFQGGEREAERTLTVIDYFTDGVIIFGVGNKVSLINPQAEKMLDVPEKEALGKSILRLTEFSRANPLVSLLGGGIKEIFKRELKIGENSVVEVTSVVMRRKGKKIGTLVILHDVSREKLVDRMKTEFVTLAAHQLRTPTSAIKWSLKMLLDGDLGDLNQGQKELLEKAYQTNNKVISLMSDLLNVAEIEEGRFLSEMELGDMEEVIKSSLDLFEHQIKTKNLNIKVGKLDKQIPQVMIDENKIKIAVKNLLDNAISYTEEGGKITVLLGQKENSKEVQVEVRDNGMGIPANQQDEVFKKFFRADNVKKVETEGTGLGLYITKNIIEAHGGRIWFRSEEGKGTSFYFTLPVKKKFGEYVGSELY